MDLDFCLRELERQNGSDLHLKVGRPPLMRIRGDLLPTDTPPLSEDELRSSLYSIMNEKLIKNFEENCEADFSYEIEGLARFRVNIFIQRGHIGSVMRIIPLDVPTIETLGLPKVLNTIAENLDGLVLVTGPTGSGKSTSLAAMIEHINQTEPLHVMTIEDPIEFVYEDKVATINQRELGIDTGTLGNALKAVLRQDPDVILMGEMRDPETIGFGITAAETGHLVFATLHTNDAKQTIERILDTMPPDARDMIRAQLSILLRAIVCQHLCKRADGTGRIAAQEILVNSPNISQLIEEGKTRSIDRAMLEGGYYGMQTFNQALHDLVMKNLITEEEAMESTANPEDLKLMFRGIQKGTSAGEVEAFEASASAPSATTDPNKKKFDRGFDF
jgi:twitching motility protein PilT